MFSNKRLTDELAICELWLAIQINVGRAKKVTQEVVALFLLVQLLPRVNHLQHVLLLSAGVSEYSVSW